MIESINIIEILILKIHNSYLDSYVESKFDVERPQSVFKQKLKHCLI